MQEEFQEKDPNINLKFSVIESETPGAKLPESNENNSELQNYHIAEANKEGIEPWIVDSEDSNHYTSNPEHIHAELEKSSGEVTTAGSETSKVTEKGVNEPYGTVKLVPKIV